MQNPGKRFESDFKLSMPDYCLVHRLRDTAQSYNKSAGTKFTRKNECDFFVFDTENRIFYCFECKSTKRKSIGYQNSEDDIERMVKWHQIESLTNLGKYTNVCAGFICNFRDEKNNMERCYFIEISSFNAMRGRSSKTSFDEIDLILNGAIKLKGEKKITRYCWDMDKFFKDNLERV